MLRCPYCNNSVIAPQTLPPLSEPAARGSSDAPTVPVKSRPPGSTQQLAEIARLVRANNKIEAIKLYHDTFLTSLKEAKEAVEAIERGELVEISRTEPFPSSDPAIRLSSAPRLASAQKKKRIGSAFLGVILAAALILLLIGIGSAAMAYQAATPETGAEAQTTRLSSQPAVVKEVGTLESRANQLINPIVNYGDASLLLSFGDKGIGPGQLQDARSIAVDEEGAIYTADYQDGRVQVFDPEGKFANQWNTGDHKSALLSLDVDQNGTVSIAQNGDLVFYNGQTGEIVKRIKLGGVGNYVDYACNTPDRGYLIITEGEDLWRFNAQGQQTLKIPVSVSKISDDSELDARAAVDGQGNLYVLGQFNNAVFKYSPEGKYLSRFGSEGDDPGQFRAAEDIALDGQGRVYVSDFKGVQIFDASGRYLGLIKVAGAAFGLAVDTQDNLYVISNQPRVYKFKVSTSP